LDGVKVVQVHNCGLKVEGSVSHEREDGFVVVVARNRSRSVVVLGNLADIAPLLLSGFIEEAISVRKAT
jgi:hypothetical protein